ncbi:MAG: hypothetical protein DPW14_14120 [Planctomycetes bacterium]|nr:hypothetical protein [Planctomycetota bacterium]
MSISREQGKQAVSDLCKYFETNREHLTQPKTKEAHIRQLLIDPLFQALGWDVSNSQRAAPQYREVILEDSLEDDGHQRAPDYAFRVGPQIKFYTEAKKCCINLRGDSGPALQLRGYGWTGKLALSILTNFVHFAVYDCTLAPEKDEPASYARLFDYNFDEYVDHWDEIWSLFSREAVWSGAFDAFANSKRKRGSSEVDVKFLAQLEDWRRALALNISINQKLDAEELNFAVQSLIDRIVFLRMAEDRGLEAYQQLLKISEATDIYHRFMELCRSADRKYNSGLFHFRSEAEEAERPDTVTPKLHIDNDVLKPIFRKLYFEHGSPYRFAVMPVEILGTIYERFLGSRITLNSGGVANVVEKPDVRKAGGVYYTPSFVVRYIVANAIGPAIAGKTPSALLGTKKAPGFCVLDLACGSGSFLLGAYQHLLDHYLDWFINNSPETHKGHVFKDPRTGAWRLTVDLKKRILLAHIYGVDIDRQAVEVARLALLLKIVEGENDETLSLQRELFSETDRVLPDLGRNIVCGNALVGPDSFHDSTPSNELLERMRPLDWDATFPRQMARGGFDCVIGNPPYRRELDYKELLDDLAETRIGKRFRMPRMDLWYYFMHQGLALTRKTGRLSFIVNSYWTAGTGADKLITQLREGAHVDEIFSLGKLKVFDAVSGQHMMVLVSKQPAKDRATRVKIAPPANGITAEGVVLGITKPIVYDKQQSELFHDGKVDIAPPATTLLSLFDSWPTLAQFGTIRQGIAENPASVNRKTNEAHGNKWELGQGVFVLSKSELADLHLNARESSIVHPYHDLSDLGRYYVAATPSVYLIYSTRKTCPDINDWPRLKAHLTRFRAIMEERRETRNGSNSWWHLHWPRDESLWLSSKIIALQMAERPSFVYSDKPAYTTFSTNVFVPGGTHKESIYYILALLNSKLLWHWFMHNAKRRGVGLEINGNVLSRAPIRSISFGNSAEKSAHDLLVQLAMSMIKLQTQLRSASTQTSRDSVSKQIESTDKRIDEVVFGLAGIGSPEVAQILQECGSS